MELCEAKLETPIKKHIEIHFKEASKLYNLHSNQHLKRISESEAHSCCSLLHRILAKIMNMYFYKPNINLSTHVQRVSLNHNHHI